MATKYPAPSPDLIQARHCGKTGSNKPEGGGIVMHGTVGPDTPGQARAIAAWWHGPTSPDTSAHYVVDPNEVIQCVGDHSEAYHCGYNLNSIGVELADEEKGPASRWNDANSKAIRTRAATLVAELCLAYAISPHRPTVADLKAHGPHGIYGHNDSRLAFGHTTHTDPIDFPWDDFLGQVGAEIARLTRKPTPKPKPPKPQPPVEHGGRWQVLVGDGNLDWHLAAWRAYYLAAYGKAGECCWTHHMPPKSVGTHAAHRLIDFMIAWGGSYTHAEVYNLAHQPAALDHKPVLSTLNLGGTLVGHIHHSLDDQKVNGKWKITTPEIVAWVATWDLDAVGILTFTECLQPNLAKRLRELLPGWTVRKQGEFICCTRNSIFRPTGKTAAIVSAVKNLAPWRQMHVAYFRTDLRATRAPGRIIVTHEPAGVESGGKPKPGAQWQAHLEGDHEVARNIRRWQGIVLEDAA